MPYFKRYLLSIILSFLHCFCSAQSAGREIISLNDNWKFSFVNDIHRTSINQTVNLPHTFNALEVMDEKSHYQRTSVVYRKELFVKKEWQNKRLFLYFEGANSVADVFVNKKYLGNHTGGYTAFCFEITSLIKPGDTNLINVMVSNAYRLDVLPLSGDFNVYGGLHRPVSLIITEQNCITPLDYGSPGVYVTPKNVSAASADINVLTKFSLRQKNNSLQLRTVIIDAGSKIVSEKISPVNDSALLQNFHLTKPHLWDGKTDPYLYSARTELLDNNQIIDTINQAFGIRYFSVDPNNGFFLNGKYLDLHGVAFHEDAEGKGSAYSDNDYKTDLGLINDLGATALRFTHYPHGKPMYELCDKTGLVVWTEIPLIGSGGHVGEGYVNSESLHNQARQFMRELVRQNYNHPSIFFWGLFNELTANFDNPAPFIKELNQLVKEEDSTRLTTCADMLNNSPFDDVSDVKAWNKYFGWYSGNVSEIGKYFDDRHKKLPGKPIAISEYGAGASVKQHSEELVQPIPSGKFHPEEWQTYLHEQYWEQLSIRTYLWAKFVWVLFDFGSTGRNEGDTVGINDKGLTTYDKKLKKDAFYFYKANWNKEPMVYIAERRNDHRTKSITAIKVYSNFPSVELIVNGKSMGKKNPDAYKRITWNALTLRPGKNIIEAKATNNKVVLKDECTWDLNE